MKKITLIHAFAFFFTNAFAQSIKTPPHNWHLMDLQDNGYYGISLNKALQLVKNKKATPIVFALIDDGMDYKHPDLAGTEWINSKEIPGNGIDDDKNGFVDDVHGWNFVGDCRMDLGNDLRHYIRLKSKIDKGLRPEQLDKKEFALWKLADAAKDDFLHMVDSSVQSINTLQSCIRLTEKFVKDKYGKDSLHFSYLRNEFDAALTDPQLKEAALKVLVRLPPQYDGLEVPVLLDRMESRKAYVTALKKNFDEAIASGDFNYYRKASPGDSAYNNTVRNYGNNEVLGGYGHGTSISGIVASKNVNGKNMRGILDRVKVMPIRVIAISGSLPKDAANAIRYAVDNGARVINMSFPNDALASFEETWRDDAIKLAEKKGVLIFVSAGNNSLDVDKQASANDNKYANGKKISNYIKVGASTPDSSLVLPISNYGKKSVDFFAPGGPIFTTELKDGYITASGTCFSAPIAASIAALIWNYYPELSYKQVIQCLEKSVIPDNTIVTKPGTDEKVPFSSLSRMGGVVNAYRAMLEAEKISKRTPMVK